MLIDTFTVPKRSIYNTTDSTPVRKHLSVLLFVLSSVKVRTSCVPAFGRPTHWPDPLSRLTQNDMLVPQL
eukprot:CFRG4293T1